MIEIVLFSVLLLTGLIMFGIGFFKKQYTLIIFSGILFLIVGGFLLYGIEYTTGVIVTDINSTTTNITDTTTTYNTIFSQGLGLFIALTGLFSLIVGIIKLFGQGGHREVEDDE